MTVRARPAAVVVGGGLAGLAAAARLAESGVAVTLLEKRGALGGSSATSGGWFALSGTEVQRQAGVEDSEQEFLADMVETGRGVADSALLRALLAGQKRAIDAIERAGAWTDELKISAGMTVPRAHLIRIRRLLAFLEDEAVAAGATIFRGRPADALITEDSRVVGSGARTTSSAPTGESCSRPVDSRAPANCWSCSRRTRPQRCRTEGSATSATD